MVDHMNDIEKPEAGLEALDRAEIAEPSGKRQVWEQQVGESPRAYFAFRLYRDLTEKRTLAKVAQTLGCSSTNVERWARRWNWVNRCYEFDLVEEEKLLQQMSRDRVAHRRRQIQIGQALQGVAVAALRELQARLEQRLPLNLAPSEVAVLMKLGDEMEGRGLGEGKERASRYTKIIVSVGEYKDEGAYEDAVKDAMTPTA